MNYFDRGVPPSTGTHREMWAKWGEYAYLPPHRYQHNVEHSSITFLYHHCLPPGEVCKIKSFIARYAARLKLETPLRPFNWFLSPYKDLRRSMAIVTYGHVYLSNTWNERAMEEFIRRHYRWAYDDRGDFVGTYDYLLITKAGDEHDMLHKCLISHWTLAPKLLLSDEPIMSLSVLLKISLIGGIMAFVWFYAPAGRNTIRQVMA